MCIREDHTDSALRREPDTPRAGQSPARDGSGRSDLSSPIFEAKRHQKRVELGVPSDKQSGEDARRHVHHRRPHLAEIFSIVLFAIYRTLQRVEYALSYR